MSPLDPVIENELDAIETALREGRPTATLAADRELQELALLLSEEAPRPGREFADELSERVHAGFPPKQGSRQLPRFSGVRNFMVAAGRRVAGGAGSIAAVTASVLLVVGLAVALTSGPSDPVPSSGGGATLAEEEAGGGGGAESGVAVPDADVRSEKDSAVPFEESPEEARGQSGGAPGQPGNGIRFAPGRQQRRIERSASLTLAAPGDQLDRVAEQITTVTDRHRGFVLSSEITSGDDGGEGGSFELRIPAERLQPALRDLAALAEVRSRTQAGQDITRAYVSTADSLQAARAERQSLLTRLENATTDEEVEALRRQLDLNAGEINRLSGQLRNLRLRTDYATVSVSLEEDGDSGSGSGGSGSIDDALDDAVGSLADSIGIALRVLGVTLPLALLGGLGWLTAGILRRRRREAALS